MIETDMTATEAIKAEITRLRALPRGEFADHVVILRIAGDDVTVGGIRITTVTINDIHSRERVINLGEDVTPQRAADFLEDFAIDASPEEAYEVLQNYRKDDGALQDIN